MVAGLAKEDVLADIQKAVNKAIAEGQTLRNFQKDFEKIVADRWDPNGGVAWRARVIWETNMRTSYAAGRYKQMKGMAEYNPYWMYCHGDSMKPRPEHLELDRVVLRHDDPWWDKNYPPNDWGCQCYVRCLTEGEVKRGGYKVASGATLPDAATDPHWQYAPGQQEYLWPTKDPGGIRPDDGQKDPGVWKNADPAPKTWATEKLPNELTEKEPKKGKMLEGYKGKPIEAVRAAIGGEQKIYQVDLGGRSMPVIVHAERFGGHLDPGREKYLGFINEILEPQEVWGNIMKRVGGAYDGKYIVRWTLLSAIKTGGKEGMVLVCDINSNGMLEAYTFYPKKDTRDINAKRKGVLIKGKKPKKN